MDNSLGELLQELLKQYGNWPMIYKKFMPAWKTQDIAMYMAPKHIII